MGSGRRARSGPGSSIRELIALRPGQGLGDRPPVSAAAAEKADRRLPAEDGRGEDVSRPGENEIAATLKAGLDPAALKEIFSPARAHRGMIIEGRDREPRLSRDSREASECPRQPEAEAAFVRVSQAQRGKPRGQSEQGVLAAAKGGAPSALCGLMDGALKYRDLPLSLDVFGSSRRHGSHAPRP